MKADTLQTSVGFVGKNEIYFRGERVFADLLGKASTSQMFALALTGRLLDSQALQSLDDIIVAMSSADPRVWPFKIARLACAGGAASFGVAATLIASESSIYGTSRLRRCAELLLDLADTNTSNDVVTAIANAPFAFGVQGRAKDERFAALMDRALARGESGKHVELCRRLVNAAREERNLEPHVYLAIAALALDMGFDAEACGALALLVLFHCALPNALEGARQHPRTLRELPIAAVTYAGHPPRKSPRV